MTVGTTAPTEIAKGIVGLEHGSSIGMGGLHGEGAIGSVMQREQKPPT